MVDWVEVWRCWVSSSLDNDTHDTWSVSSPTYSVPSPVSCTAVDGDLVYSGNDEGGIEIRNIELDNIVGDSKAEIWKEKEKDKLYKK